MHIQKYAFVLLLEIKIILLGNRAV